MYFTRTGSHAPFPKTTKQTPEDIWQNLIKTPQTIYPYPLLDGYTLDQTPGVAVPTITYATDAASLLIYPASGGKVASFVSAESGELLFNNPVIQPGNLARRNAH